MGIEKCEDGWRVKVRIRQVGKIVQKSRIINGTRADAKLLYADLVREIRNAEKSSLTTLEQVECSTFSEIVQFYLARKPMNGGLRTILDKLERDLGPVPVGLFSKRFDSYLQILKTEKSQITGKLRSPTTINRYIMVARLVFNFACKRPQRDITGITENPVNGYEMALENGRDRVWTDAERERLFATLQKLNSPLYWLVYFSQWNPIRRGDLQNLTRENLDMLKPWVHFYPSKTRKRKPRETCLVCIDKSLLEYFKSLPHDCPYLFPRFEGEKWYKFGEFKHHWATICREAGIPDFHWHDLKHCAETWMLDNGFDERDLMNLGIQYDRKMIERYYHRHASKGLKKWQKLGGCETDCEAITVKTA